MVKEVEELGQKLRTQSLAERNVLSDRKIHVIEPWPDDNVAAQVAEAGNRSEYRSVEPTLDATDDVDRTGHIGTQCVRYSIERAVARDDVDGVAALHLGDPGKLPAIEEPVDGKWQFVDKADDDAVARVEIRKATITSEVIAVLHNDTLRTQGRVVDRLRPRVGNVEHEASPKPSVRCHPER